MGLNSASEPQNKWLGVQQHQAECTGVIEWWSTGKEIFGRTDWRYGGNKANWGCRQISLVTHRSFCMNFSGFVSGERAV